MIIRVAHHQDFEQIEAVHEAAFSATNLGHNGEAELVRALHASDDTLVSLIAEHEGEMVGHVMFSRMHVEADGTLLSAAGLAPVAVLPKLQNRGTGSSLISAGLEALQTAGIQISFVLGHPAYYPRFGYSAVDALPFSSPFAGPHFMALWLDTSLPRPTSGRADYAKAFG
jgi:putative acetyltransferase